ncbi:MAG: ABC transporter substrate-binding protein [Gammaproteobacteria bacterium]|nr:ABC transporter substrate-binding protein [Gammaproteobacteria bacterium]
MSKATGRLRRVAGLLGLFVLLLARAQPLWAQWNDPYPERDSGKNILYAAFTERPKRLDPAQAYNADEYAIIGQIYEPPFEYQYLLRPYTLVPLTARSIPRPVYLDRLGRRLPADAPTSRIAYSVYTIHLRSGIMYQPSPCFARDASGRHLYQSLTPAQLRGIRTIAGFRHTGTRELVAADYVYEIKRLASPWVQSPLFSVLRHYIVGFNRFARTVGHLRATLPKVDGKPPYIDLARIPMAGVKVLGRYTYSIEIRGKYPQFLYWMAMPFFAPMPPEADRFFSQPGMAKRDLTLDWYAVGTGPYMLTVNNPAREMILERNPNYHPDFYPRRGEPSDAKDGLLKDAGKRLPFIKRIVFIREREDIPYWDKFLQGYYDESGVSAESFNQVVQFSAAGQARLSPSMHAKGIRLATGTAPSIYYYGFNMLDPVVGGYSRRSRLLRRAISIAINTSQYISIFRNGRGIPAQSPLPPGIFGYQSGCAGRDPYVYDCVDGRIHRKPIAVARRLLAEAGYPDGRDERTGKPLLLYYDTPEAGPEAKAHLDWMRKQFRKLNIQLVVRSTDYNRFQQKMRRGEEQIFAWGWNADYPDPEDFLFLLYGPDSEVANNGENAANYDNPRFNRLYNEMRNMDNGPAREAIIKRMIRLVQRDAPWVWGYYPVSYLLHQAWVYNVKPNYMATNSMKYLRLDPALRAHDRRAWNKPVVWPLWVIVALLAAFLLPAVLVYRQKERRSPL